MLTTTERQVGMCCRAERIADHEEGDIACVGVAKDVFRVGFNGLTIGKDDRAAVVGFLLQIVLVISRKYYPRTSLKMINLHSPIAAGQQAGRLCTLRDIHARRDE